MPQFIILVYLQRLCNLLLCFQFFTLFFCWFPWKVFYAQLGFESIYYCRLNIWISFSLFFIFLLASINCGLSVKIEKIVRMQFVVLWFFFDSFILFYFLSIFIAGFYEQLGCELLNFYFSFLLAIILNVIGSFWCSLSWVGSDTWFHYGQ